MSRRITQVNELIRSHIAGFLVKETSFKEGVFVTVTKVDTTPDLRYTRVFVSIFPEDEAGYGMATLQHEASMLQIKLHRKLSMKPLPKLSFHLDTTEKEADEVERILREISEE